MADLIGRMTLEEKVAQMLSHWQGKQSITGADGRFDPSGAGEWFRLGIGRIERTSEERGAREQAEYTNAIQQWVKEDTRLGIPVMFHEESLHGLMAPEATSFPQAIALAGGLTEFAGSNIVVLRRGTDGKMTRIGHQVLNDGRKVRICRKCEGVVDK